MDEEELERMRAYAAAAAEEPHQKVMTYASEYARDVPKLLDELVRRDELLRTIARALRGEAGGMEYANLDELPKDIIGTNRIWGESNAKLQHRLCFCEMLLDKLDATVGDLPWREAARLREAADGIDEPETMSEPTLYIGHARSSTRSSDIAVNLHVVAHGAAHHSGKFYPSVFVGVMPVWDGLPVFETQGEAVEVAEAKATLVFRRLFAEEVPFSFASKHDDSIRLEALAALEETEKALAKKPGADS